MLLLGPSRSPFVRRVATTLRLYDFEFEQRELGITGDTWQELLAYSPLGRVPVLVLPDNRRLTDSAVILDYLDHKAGAERTLTPLSGPKRTVSKP